MKNVNKIGFPTPKIELFLLITVASLVSCGVVEFFGGLLGVTLGTPGEGRETGA